MTKRLHIADDLSLPALEAQTQTIVVYGGKGMGKTNFGSVVAEELAANGLRFSWLDPVGVSWGLKHSSDGRGPGVELLILGGIHGDLPIVPTAGEVVADFVVDEDVSVIIDISRHASGKMWSGGEKTRFVLEYMKRLYSRQGERRRPLMQIIDECGRFAPENPPKGAIDIMECRAAIEEVVELGRNVGIGVMLMTQRSARMAKSVSESADHQSENAHRLVESTSAIRHAAAEFREIVQAFGADIKKILNTLSNADRNEQRKHGNISGGMQ